MNKTRVWLTAAVLLLATACSSSSDPRKYQEQLTDCTRRSFLLTLSWFEQVGAMVDVISGGDPRPGIIVTPSVEPTDPANTWIVSSEFPSDGIGSPDTTLSGKLRFSADPSGGVANGDSAVVSLSVSGATSPLTGSLEGTLTFASDVAATWSGVSAGGNRDLGCAGTFVADAGDPLVLEVAAGAASRLAARVFDLDAYGVVAADVVALGHRLQAGLELTRLSQLATVDGTIDGKRIDVYTFELFPAPEVIDLMVQCAVEHLDGFGLVFEKTADVIGAIRSPGDYPDVTLVQTAFSTWRFSVRIDGISDAYTGSITLPPQPGATGSLTWTARLGGGAVTGGSTTPLFVVAPGGTVPGAVPGRLWGGGRLESAGPACATTFDLPVDDALEFDLGGNLLGGGIMTLQTVQGTHALIARLDFSSGEPALVLLTLDGLPIAPERIGLGG